MQPKTKDDIQGTHVVNAVDKAKPWKIVDKDAHPAVAMAR